MGIEKTRRTVEISANIGKGCDHCAEFVGGGLGDDGAVTASINHYIEAHGYRLLHVGTQTNHGPDGNPWHNTVAILGHEDPPAVREPPKIEFRGMPNS